MVFVKKRIVILGSTGSIGTQALNVVAKNPHLFEVVGIVAGGAQPQLLVAQAKKLGLKPHQVGVSNVAAAKEVSEALGTGVISGSDAAAEMVRMSTSSPGAVDVVLNGLVGSAGLEATIATINSRAALALANKESLVAGGDFIMEQARARGAKIIPVDSEHSAMAQCLRAGEAKEVSRLVLTASGGPFWGWNREQMMQVTPKQAAAHPTWSMGQMNTLNSATLINKGLELIEATLLFDIPADRIDVSVHRQSIIHSMVTFNDGATIAQASITSMELPIALALNWPHRVAEIEPAVDFTKSFSWDFAPVDNVAFPAVELAREVATKRATWPAIYNAANEEAAAAFLAHKIAFPHIVDVVAEVVGGAADFAAQPHSVAQIVEIENEARRRAQVEIAKLAF
ncbi:1-deoxy-D-xylulose-5-phosphate reductoisomerase [Corynebacterium caspium]|uniref:1-deoxy-D-xylulose-5-phosphate reductoisomerase n=1 Tax=Corynebacterium caspium TaxID=234828 RepID=UPI00058F60B2|nr:1-deoxy-D-xylulose-5-phosphate reductoisomerase [Corynebacterium caspium]WKD59074.1 1-deoxy-D-xylulose 5-phosphate reductoisomerase [Corynebacterium caspium DSM 44850]